MTRVEIYNHQPIGDSINIAEAGLSLGNVDPRPRFGPLEDVARNRSKLIEELGLGEGSQAYALVLTGGDDYVDIDEPDERIQQTDGLQETNVVGDALITRQSGIGVMLNPADCIPLVMHNAEAGTLSLVHLGWKGSALRLHDKVLDYTQTSYGARPSQTRAYLGPSISAKNFVTDKLSDAQENDPDWKPFTPEFDDGFHIDIPGFVIATLVKNGLDIRNIVKSPQDTGASDSGYFSYTRHKREGVPDGRNGFAVVMH